MKDYYQDDEQYQDELNPSRVDNIAIWKGILVVIIGLLGFNLFAMLAAEIIKAILPESEIQARIIEMNGWINFSSYAIGLISIIVVLGQGQIEKMFRKYKQLQVYLNGIGIGFIVLLAQSLYSMIANMIFGPVQENVNQGSIIDMIKTIPFLTFFVTVIFAPLLEEMVYRYSLFGMLHKKNRIFAYIVTLLVFGLIHFDFTCFKNGADAMKIEFMNLPAYLIAGGILCYAYEKNGSLISSITAHATNNLIAFLQVLLLKDIMPS